MRSTAGNSTPPVFLASPAELAGDQLVLSGPEGRHAADVRRLTAGERVDLTDGAGQLAECVVTRAQRGTLELAVRGRRIIPPADPALAVAQAIPKGERGQLAVELMTEVGVDVVIPWAAQRCVVRWSGERGDRALARWRSTAREAGKQARRARFPEVTGPAGLTGLTARLAAAACAIVLDPDADISLGALPLPGTGEILLVVGPEGGLAPEETGALTAAGAVTAHLGPTVLRASTAGAVAAAVLLSRLSRW
ncbi:MAG TPA: 16S rRNA (uracil(1498)-N(3))-methyltransferase [Streptosporangiaceae bacterium]